MKTLIEKMKALRLYFVSCSLFDCKETQCKICNDTKVMEVLVMGTDTEYVECSYCSDKPEYKKFQYSLK